MIRQSSKYNVLSPVWTQYSFDLTSEPLSPHYLITLIHRMITLARFTHLEPLCNRKMQRVYRQLRFFARQSEFVALWVLVVSQNARETSIIWYTPDDDVKPIFPLPYTPTMVDDIESRILKLSSAFKSGFSRLLRYIAQRGALWQKGKFLAEQKTRGNATLTTDAVISAVTTGKLNLCCTTTWRSTWIASRCSFTNHQPSTLLLITYSHRVTYLLMFLTTSFAHWLTYRMSMILATTSLADILELTLNISQQWLPKRFASPWYLVP